MKMSPKRIFLADNTRVRIYFFPEFNIRLYDKNSESDSFFFLHQNQNILFSNITLWTQNQGILDMIDWLFAAWHLMVNISCIFRTRTSSTIYMFSDVSGVMWQPPNNPWLPLEMTKTLNQILFFSSTKIRIFCSATLEIRIFF
jgi:hypothetical protein